MQTTTIYPKKAPVVLMGDLDVVQPDALIFARPEYEVEQDYIRMQITARQYAGMASQITEVNGPSRAWRSNGHTFDDRRAYYQRQYGVRTTYHNYTKHNVTVVDRLNMPMVLLPDDRASGANYDEPCFIIRQEYHFDDNNAMLRTLDGLKEYAPLHGRELRQIREVLQKDSKLTGSLGARIVLEYPILESDLEQDIERTVYHHKTDVLVSFNEPKNVPRHPASAEYTKTDAPLFNTFPTGQNDLALLVRYVTNKPDATPKYIRFAHKVLRLIPQHDHPAKLTVVTRRDKSQEVKVMEELYDYIEFIYPTIVDTENPLSAGIRCTRIPLDDAMSLYGVSNSIQDLIEPQAAFESTSRKLKDKVDFLEMELKRQSKEADEKLKESERSAQEKYNTLKREYDQIKRAQEVQLEEIKEQREEKNFKQKFWFEAVKFAINTCSVILGMIPLLLKVRAAMPAS